MSAWSTSCPPRPAPTLDGRVLLRARRAIALSRLIAPRMSAIRGRLFADAAALNVAVNSNASMPFRRFSAFLNTASAVRAEDARRDLEVAAQLGPRPAHDGGVRLGLTVRHRAGLVAAEHGVGEELEELADVERAHLGLRHLVDGGRDEAISGMVNGRTERPLCQCPPRRWQARATRAPPAGRVAGSSEPSVQGHAPVAAPVRQSLDPTCV